MRDGRETADGMFVEEGADILCLVIVLEAATGISHIFTVTSRSSAGLLSSPLLEYRNIFMTTFLHNPAHVNTDKCSGLVSTT